MSSCIVVHNRFEHSWPFASDHFRSLWQKQGEVDFTRLQADDERPLGEIISHPEKIERLVCLSVPVTLNCLKALKNLKEAYLPGIYTGDALNRHVLKRASAQTRALRSYVPYGAIFAMNPPLTQACSAKRTIHRNEGGARMPSSRWSPYVHRRRKDRQNGSRHIVRIFPYRCRDSRKEK